MVCRCSASLSWLGVSHYVIIIRLWFYLAPTFMYRSIRFWVSAWEIHSEILPTSPEDKKHGTAASFPKGKWIGGIVTAVLCKQGSTIIDRYRALDQASRCFCILTSDHAVKLLLVFYALYEVTFVALAHTSEVLAGPQIPSCRDFHWSRWVLGRWKGGGGAPRRLPLHHHHQVLDDQFRFLDLALWEFILSCCFSRQAVCCTVLKEFICFISAHSLATIPT